MRLKYLIPGAVYALNEKLFSRDTLKRFRDIKSLNSISAAELEEVQLGKLRALLQNAYKSTKYYKKTFDDSGFNPELINSLNDLQTIPLIGKPEIRSDPEAFVSKDKTIRLARYATSGSTGEPLIFYLSADRVASNKAAYLMLYEWWGLHAGDREVVMWGSQRDVSTYNFLKKARDILLNTRLLPAFYMDESVMRRYLSFIQSYRPADIFGYAHTIYILARFAKNRNIRMNDLGIKVVFTTAELLQDYQRETISDVFGCPVSNCYGGRESGLIAFECPEGKMHLNPNIITEIVSGGRRVNNGEKGEIVVTDLESYGMPFIRYRTGDEGIMGRSGICPCGRPFNIMEKVLGRNTDYIVNKKGDFIHPLALEYIFRELAGLDYFKIVQKKEDELIIDLVVSFKFDKTIEPLIRSRIDKVMGVATDVIFRFIEKSDIETGDKYKFVISEVINKYIQGA